eukprot:gene6860-9394_t
MSTSSTLPPPSATSPFITNGIKVSFLQEFIALNGGEIVFKNLATREVTDKFIKPHTIDKKVSYCEITDQENFINDINNHSNSKMVVNCMLAKVNLKRSSCYFEADKTNIFDVIRKSVGFEKLNSVVYEQFHLWEIKTTITTMLNEQNESKKVEVMHALASVFKNQGRYSLAKRWFQRSYNQGKAILTIIHPNTLSSLHNLATVYHYQHKLEIAEYLFERCIKLRKTVLGEDHRDTLQSMNDLGMVYMYGKRNGKRNLLEAENLLQMSYDKRFQSLGTDDHDTLSSINNIGLLKYHKGCFDDAYDSLDLCFEKRKKLLGEGHPDTISTMNNIALVLLQNGKCEDAWKLFKACYDRRRTMFGENHPTTLNSMNSLAICYDKLKKYDLAQTLYESCYEKRKQALGDNHQSTKSSKSSLDNFKRRTEAWKTKTKLMNNNVALQVDTDTEKKEN